MKYQKMNSLIKFSLFLLLLVAVLSCKQDKEAAKIHEEHRTQIEMITSYGTIRIDLYNETPLHRDNFINLVRNKAYDSILFHRVIKDFMIQGGDPDSKMALPNDTLGQGDVPYVVDAEFNTKLFHKKGVLAAARDNNPEKASSGMQFYIVQGKVFNDSLLDRTEMYTNGTQAMTYYEDDPDKQPILDSIQHAMDNRQRTRMTLLRDSLLKLANMEENFEPYVIPEEQRSIYKTLGGTPHLDQNYTVFGEVVQGQEVVDSIAGTPTDSFDRPLKDIRMITLKVVE